jgi:transketolase
MSALMDLPVIYIFTHDSITVGEDGPTHQPVEQLAMLRSTPNVEVYRPYDANEVLGSYKSILENRKPSCLILSRNKVELNNETSVNDVKKGAYVLKEERGELDAVLISCGEELGIALEIQQILAERGVGIRLVSMPSTTAFEKQTQKYKESIIPKHTKTFVLELSSSYSWYKYTNNEEHLFTIDHFGESASKDKLLKKYGFDSEKIANRIEELLR